MVQVGGTPFLEVGKARQQLGEYIVPEVLHAGGKVPLQIGGCLDCSTASARPLSQPRRQGGLKRAGIE